MVNISVGVVGVLLCRGLKHFLYNNSNDRDSHKTQPSQSAKWSRSFMSLSEIEKKNSNTSMVNTSAEVLFCRGLKHFLYSNSNNRNPHKTQPSQLPKWSGPFMSLSMANTSVGVVRFLLCLWAHMTVILLCGVSSRASFDNLNRSYCKIYQIDHLCEKSSWLNICSPIIKTHLFL